MRARSLLTAGVIAAAACSPSGDAESRLEPRVPPQLALPAGDDAAAVVSDIEAAQPPAVPTRQEAAPEADGADDAGDHATSSPDARGSVDALAQPTFRLAAAPVAAPQPTLIRTAERITTDPADAEAAAPHDHGAVANAGAVDEGDDDTDRGPIIIRGGVTETDPCRIHGPMRPPQGALINNRLPQIGPRTGLPRMPSRGGMRGGWIR